MKKLLFIVAACLLAHSSAVGAPALRDSALVITESATGGDSSGSPAGNRVYYYTWNGSVLNSPALILDLPATPGPNHNGGIIRFGPDGKLYVLIGDLNRDGQLQNFTTGPGPDDTSVILRLNDDGTTPNDNPFFAQGGNVARYYAYGIRNSSDASGAHWSLGHGGKQSILGGRSGERIG